MTDRRAILRNIVFHFGPLGTLHQAHDAMARHGFAPLLFDEWWPVYTACHAERIREMEKRWKPAKKATTHAVCYECLNKTAKNDGLCVKCEREQGKRGAA